MSPAAAYVHSRASLGAVFGLRSPARSVERVLQTFCPNDGHPNCRLAQSGGRSGIGRSRAPVVMDVGSVTSDFELHAAGRPTAAANAAHHEAVRIFTRALPCQEFPPRKSFRGGNAIVIYANRTDGRSCTSSGAARAALDELKASLWSTRAVA
jgi:hypothetical protein